MFEDPGEEPGWMAQADDGDLVGSKAFDYVID